MLFRSMKCGLAALVLALCAAVLGSIPTTEINRFADVGPYQVTQAAVGSEDLAIFSVGNNALQNNAVTSRSLANLAISKPKNLSPDTVTTDSVAFDLVTLTILPFGTVPAQSQDPTVTIQTGAQAIWPWENVLRPNLGDSAVVDAPAIGTSYRVENKARGPGKIIGWYPNRNGHLLRYQSSRSLRAITCQDLTEEIITNEDIHDTDDDDFTSDIWSHFHRFNNALVQPPTFANGVCQGSCVTLDCSAFDTAHVTDLDFNCILSTLPQTCGYTTSVEDVNNPQEGVPVYSPSVERITINSEGLVEMWYFGSGSVQPGADVRIEVTVVVLLDQMYGADRKSVV